MPSVLSTINEGKRWDNFKKAMNIGKQQMTPGDNIPAQPTPSDKSSFPKKGEFAGSEENTADKVKARREVKRKETEAKQKKYAELSKTNKEEQKKDAKPKVEAKPVDKSFQAAAKKKTVDERKSAQGSIVNKLRRSFQDFKSSDIYKSGSAKAGEFYKSGKEAASTAGKHVWANKGAYGGAAAAAALGLGAMALLKRRKKDKKKK